jgi:hypothetical protein
MKQKITLSSVILFIAMCFNAQVTIFPNGSTWKYMDNGSDQGTAWYGTSFNDASWASGPSELGYGDGDEATVVNACGTATTFPTCTNKYITTYFRRTFNLTSVSSYTAYTMNFKRDDGVVIYFNGVEVYRNNMPTGTITYTTPASTACSDDGTTVFSIALSASVLTTGTNVIAAEIHQNVGTSSDITFQFNLVGNTNFIIPQIVKGPYLVVGTPTSMVVRWETNVATDSKVMYGINSNSLSTSVTNTNVAAIHTVQINGLTPYTKYYYNIGSSTLVTQGDTNNYFVTNPIPGTPGQYRFWMVGDCGNASTNQVNCKNQYVAYNGGRITNAMLLSGDNAYNSGTNAEYNNSFFGIYQNDVLKKMTLYSAPGNHDYNNGASTATTVPYFTHFQTPTNGEAGGVASNNPAYYSFDYGNVHFLSLDSYGTTGSNQKMYDTLSPQVVWIKQDLAANNKKWTIAYWHHPPYTMGSHNSDTEGDLMAIRNNFIRILERNKVDMIICGHSHDYERSKLMNGHYGNEASFSATTHNKSSSSALYDGSSNSCPYAKDSTINKIGTVYVLSGSAGQLGGQQTSFPHDAMYYSNATNGGTFIMDVEDNKLDAKWLCADGAIRDQFTMVKDVKSVKSYTVLPGQTVTVSASWPGTYVWSNSVTTRSTTISSASNASFWVKDVNNCIADTFKLRVLPAVNFSATPPFCASSAIQFNNLSTNNTTAWSWSVSPPASVAINNATVQNPGITFNATGIYTISLIASNIYGAGSIFTQTVQINVKPTLSATSNTNALCPNQTVSLSASGATSYSWSNGASGASIAVTPTSSTIYTVTGTDANGCSNNSTVAISTSTSPALIIVSNPTNAAICIGNSITLSASGAANYTWTGGITNGTSFTPTTGASYTVTAIGANGCQSSSVRTVTVNPLPVLLISSNPTTAVVCSGSSVSFSASGATTYSWTGGITNGIAFTPTSNTTYTLTATDTNGCSNTGVRSVTVSPLPVLSIAGSSAICAGTSATLSVSGASTYIWNTAASGSSIVVNPVVSTTYSVTGTDLNNCSSTLTKPLTINPIPTITVNSGFICVGSPFVMMPSGAATYNYSSGSASVAPFTTTSYTVSGVSAAGCIAVLPAIATVSVGSLPVISISISQPTICVGQSVTLVAAGAITYTWNNAGSNATSISRSPSITTTYSLTGTDLNGCMNGNSAVVTVNTLPLILANTTSSLLCVGETATLSASGANTYTWSNFQTTAAVVVSPTITTTYTVNGTSTQACIAKTAITQSVSECTAIESVDLNGNSASIFPNPNRGNFSILLNGIGNFELVIYNATGQSVYTDKITAGLTSIQLNATKGIYFYTLRNKGSLNTTGKIIIEN